MYNTSIHEPAIHLSQSQSKHALVDKFSGKYLHLTNRRRMSLFNGGHVTNLDLEKNDLKKALGVSFPMATLKMQKITTIVFLFSEGRCG